MRAERSPGPAPAASVGSKAAPSAAQAGRVEAVDAARGVALLAMAFYHFVWDLEALGLSEAELALGPVGRLAARVIAGAFLALVGIGLVLGHGEGLRWRSFARRLAKIGGAAAAVTAATLVATPQSYIFFGILHCIALSSLLALPFLRAPLWGVVGAAALVAALPAMVGGGVFDAPALAWLGLGRAVPETNDYVPLVPWFAAVLAGIAAARLARPWLEGERRRGWRARGRLGRALVAAGRRSLLVYLLHQPVLLALLVPLAYAIGWARA